MERVGPYRIVESLGEGGMASVWRGVGADGLEVAVKVLSSKLGNTIKGRARFYSEARAMGEIDHPNVATIYDHGEDDGIAWLAMELLDGGTCEGWVRRHGAMPPQLAVNVAIAVLTGLEAVHANGTVHRDVKPANVLLGSDGSVKITDFGVAHAEDSTLTRTGSVMGTLAYMAPEQRIDAKSADLRADVFSTGGLLWSLLAGRDPADLVAPEVVESLSAPAEVVGVIRKALRYKPEDRYPSAAMMRADLEIARITLPPDPPDTPPLGEPLLGPLPQIPVGTFEPPAPSEGWRGEAPSMPTGWDSGTPAPEPFRPPARPPPRPTPLAEPSARAPWSVEPVAAPVVAPTQPAPAIEEDPPRRSIVPILLFAGAMLASASATGVTIALLGGDEPEPAMALEAAPVAPNGVELLYDDDVVEPSEGGGGAAAGGGTAAPARVATGRLMVLTPEPSAITIDGQDVGQTPVEVAIGVGFHKIDLAQLNSAKKTRLRVNVRETSTVELCWSFTQMNYCGVAELTAAKLRW